MIKILLLILSMPMFLLGYCQGQQSKDSLDAKKGLNIGFLPVVGYNTDIGFQYGLIVNIFDYGDGTLYPDYKYSLYTEFSRTTKGGGVNQIFFDRKELFGKNIRMTADLSYLTELALNFYGFNGYDAIYHKEYENDDQAAYISRMYYRHQRKFTRMTFDLQGNLKNNKLLWFGGLGYFNFKMATVDIEKLNKGKKEEDKLPDEPLLYDQYVDAGLIRPDEAKGGIVPSIKAGLIYDSRDNEANPNRGIWTEVLLSYTPKIAGNHNFSYLKLAFTHRQYLTIVKKRLTFAYRLGYQGTLSGKVPFFMQPYMLTTYAKVTTTDGLGGAKTLRGILRNRVVADGIAYANAEIRWKFYETRIWNQNLYLGLIGFMDAGQSVKKMDVPKDMNDLPEDLQPGFDQGAEKLHYSMGSGLRVVLNENFIVAFDYGISADKRDGKDGFYAGIGYLF